MTAETRRYYHQRTGSHLPPTLDLDQARKLIVATYKQCAAEFLFDEALGYWCVDERSVPGTCGEDVAGWIHIHAWLEDVYPFCDKIPQLEEPIMFAVIELLWDLVSLPERSSGYHHTFSDCGWHSFTVFDKVAGQKVWRDRMNRILEFYADGFQLSETGEVQRVANPELVRLMTAPIPTNAGEENKAKIDDAIRRFRSGKSSPKERQVAVVDLANVLEFYRPQVKQHLTRKDEGDIFDLANNYALRHHNQNQRADYGEEFLDWIFYLYLSTIQLNLKLMARGGE